MLHLLATCILLLIPIPIRDTTTLKVEPYPKVYTMRQARKAYSAGERNIWAWYLVNMFPQLSDSVVAEIASRGLTPDSLSFVVRSAFDAYFRLDPAWKGSGDSIPSYEIDSPFEKAQNAEKLISVVLLNSVKGRTEESTLTYLLQTMHWIPLDSTVKLKPGLKMLKPEDSRFSSWEESNYALRTKVSSGRGAKWIWLAVVRCTSREVCDSILNRQLNEIKGFSPEQFRSGRMPSVESGPFLIMRFGDAVLKLSSFCSSYSSANEWSSLVKDILSRQLHSADEPPIICYCGGPMVEGDISLIK